MPSPSKRKGIHLDTLALSFQLRAILGTIHDPCLNSWGNKLELGLRMKWQTKHVLIW